MPTPYSGNPSNNPNAVNIPAGSDAPTAALFDTAFEGILDKVAFNQAHAGAGNLLSWPAASNWSPGIGPYLIQFYDVPLWQDWIVAEYGAAAGTFAVYHGTGNDGVWTQTGSNITYAVGPSSMAVDINGVIWVVAWNAGNVNGWHAAGYGLSFSTTSTTAITNVSDYQVTVVGTNPIGAVGSTSAGHAALGITSSGGFTAAAGFSTLTCQNWILRSNGSYALAIPVGASSPLAYESIDGSTWTSSAIGSGTETVVDLTWDAFRQQWVLLTIPGGGVSKTYFSFDGATWVALGTMGSGSVTVTGAALTCVNGTYFALSSVGGNTWALLYSLDGAKWVTGRTLIFGNSGANVPRLFPAPNQLAAAPCISPTASSPTATNVRFSGLTFSSDVSL